MSINLIISDKTNVTIRWLVPFDLSYKKMRKGQPVSKYRILPEYFLNARITNFTNQLGRSITRKQDG